MFLSAVLHDLGLTDHAVGSQRFEIEGAGAARTFLTGKGVSRERAQKVWDNIALHTWDINLFRDDTSRLMELGVLYDVVGVEDAKLDPTDVAEVVRRYPRLNFKRVFNDTLTRELDRKQPYKHVFSHLRPHRAKSIADFDAGRTGPAEQCSLHRLSLIELYAPSLYNCAAGVKGQSLP